jgi:NifU-like protein
VSDKKIRRVILENDLTTAEQVTSYVKAGGGCSSCLSQIDDLIAEVQQEKATGLQVATAMAVVKEQVANGQPLTTVQKIAAIQEVLQEVRPVLIADGGDVELFDVEGNTVKVILKGACGSCASSTATLKGAIETRLQERILPSLVVEAV